MIITTLFPEDFEYVVVQHVQVVEALSLKSRLVYLHHCDTLCLMAGIEF